MLDSTKASVNEFLGKLFVVLIAAGIMFALGFYVHLNIERFYGVVCGAIAVVVAYGLRKWLQKQPVDPEPPPWIRTEEV